jgi:hypothetical protein
MILLGSFGAQKFDELPWKKFSGTNYVCTVWHTPTSMGTSEKFIEI